MLDILIVGGQYPDFKEYCMKRGNIGIKDGKIAYIGYGEPDAEEVINAEGKIVSPGFIDIHMHEEDFHEGEKYVIADMMLEMGVTTAVGGNCGIQNQDLSEFKNTIARLGGSPVNYLMFAGYNTFRYELGIERYAEATKTEQAEIRRLLKRELSEGACGISFGIEYDPGMTFDEIMYACGATCDPRLLVSAHYRDDGNNAIESIEEMIRIADGIPMKFQISHLSSCSAMGQMDEALRRIDGAKALNPKLDFDTYPYSAFSTHIGSAVFEDGCLEGWGKDYKDILLTEEPYFNVYCTKEIFEDAREKYPDMLAVAFVMREEEISAAVSDKNGMIASDAIIKGGNGHPRAAGTFPRVLGKYVRDEKALSMTDALKKISWLPAERLGLRSKGRIEEGCDGDITVFDPETIRDGATFTDIHIKPEGIQCVLINGKKALEGKEILNGRLGRFISSDEMGRD